MIKNKGTKILILSLTFSGLLSTTTGIALNNMKANTSTDKIDIKVVERQVARLKSNIPVLKDMEVEINEPISVDVKDYISNIDEISSNALRAFKIDTSLVNVTQAGKYSYTIQYNGKKYKGSIAVKDKEKEDKIIETLYIKNFSIKVNEQLPTEISNYLENKVDTLDPALIKLDTSKVDIHVAGEYQYTITYGNMLYTGTIKVYEEQATLVPGKIGYKVHYTCESDSYSTSPNKAVNTRSVTVDFDKEIKNIKEKNTNVLSGCSSVIDHIEIEKDGKISNSNGHEILINNNDKITVYLKQIGTETTVQPQNPTVDGTTVQTNN